MFTFGITVRGCLMRRPGYIKAVLIGVDQLVNATVGPVLNKVLASNRFGFPDETLSSVFGKEVKDGRCRGCYWICRGLHLLDPNHCNKSIEYDEGKA